MSETSKPKKRNVDPRNFMVYIQKVLHQVHPQLRIQHEALETVNDMVNYLITQYVIKLNFLHLEKGSRKTTSDRMIQTLTPFVLQFQPHLVRHTIGEGVKAVTRFNSYQGPRATKARKAGLVFSVSRVRAFLADGSAFDRLSPGPDVYLAAVMEYLVAEILDLAGNAAITEHRVTISPRHIMMVIANDPELSQVLGHIIMTGGILGLTIKSPNDHKRHKVKYPEDCPESVERGDKSLESKLHSGYQRLFQVAGIKRHSALVIVPLDCFVHSRATKLVEAMMLLTQYYRRTTIQMKDLLLAADMLNMPVAIGLAKDPTKTRGLQSFRALGKKSGQKARQGSEQNLEDLTEAEEFSEISEDPSSEVSQISDTITRTIPATITRPHRLRPGTRALMNIQQRQKNSNKLMFALETFENYIRGLVQEINQQLNFPEDQKWRFSAGVIQVLQKMIEAQIIQLLKTSNYNLHTFSDRVTLDQSDINATLDSYHMMDQYIGYVKS